MLESIIENYIKDNTSKAVEDLKKLKEDLGFFKTPTTLKECAASNRILSRLASEVRAVRVTMNISDVKRKLGEVYEGKIQSRRDFEDAVFKKYDDIIEQTKNNLEGEAKAYNDKLRDEVLQHDTPYIKAKEKQDILATYTDQILDLCEVYGVTTSDMAISNASFTIDELNEVYDLYIDYIKRKKRLNANPITAFKETVKIRELRAGILLLALILCFTPIFDMFALVALGGIVYNQVKAKETMRLASMLLGLLYNIKPMEMGFKGDVEEDLLIEESVNEDEDERFNKIAEQLEAELGEDSVDAITDELKAESIKLLNQQKEISDRLAKEIANINDMKDSILSEIDGLSTKVDAIYKDLRSNVKLLGDIISTSVVFDTKFKLGCEDSIFEEIVDIGDQNIVIRPCRDEGLLNRFIQCLVANALCNVRPGYMHITVYDPNNIGRVVAPFSVPEMDKIITTLNEDLSRTLSQLQERAISNVQNMQGRSIKEFNEESERLNRIATGYELLLILSQPKTVEENEALNKFMEYSTSQGILIWIVTESNFKNTKIFNKPFEGVNHPYEFNSAEFCNRVAENFMNVKKNMKTKGINWREFVDAVIPVSKRWKESADRFIKLYPGYRLGDPSKPTEFTVGNEGNVHILGVGGTGAGKSVFLNHTVCSIGLLYHPKDVELWLCDFKGTEFKAYMNTPAHPFLLPHIKACLCTSDGAYATSLFNALRKESDKRQELFKLAGVKNLPDWNKLIRSYISEGLNKDPEVWGTDAPWTDDDVLPRVLLVCDEFQVIFQKGEPKEIDSIKKDIQHLAKVARTMGIHIFFTSQSMQGTLSDDVMDQFSLRFALRCSKDVSQKLLGTTRASDILDKNGSLVVQSQGMKPEDQVIYKTPFLNDSAPEGNYSDFHKVVKELYEKALAEGFKFRDIISYEESQIRKIKELYDFYDEVYETKPEVIPDSGLMVLGERMTYNENRAPDNIILDSSNNTHIMSVWSDQSDLYNFVNQIHTNIQKHRVPGQIFWNSQVSELGYLCEVDERCNPELLGLSTEKTSPRELLGIFLSIYEARKANPEVNAKEPMYIILIGWNKAPGFAIEKDMGLVGAYNNLLALCGEFGMHFIFVNSSMMGFGLGTVNQCSYRIAGFCDEDSSTLLLGKKVASERGELKNGYMYLLVDGEIRRAKLYRSEIKRTVKQKEIRL